MNTEKKKKIFLFIFIISLPILLTLLSSKIILSTSNFNNDRSLVMNFIKSNNPDSTIFQDTTITEKEISHLLDVNKLIKSLNRTFYILLLTITLILTYFRKNKTITNKLLFYGGITSLFLPIIVTIFSSINFTKTFEIFHKIFFSQGNWSFPIRSFLISTFPEEFFLTKAIQIFILTIILSLITIIISKKEKLLRYIKK